MGVLMVKYEDKRNDYHKTHTHIYIYKVLSPTILITYPVLANKKIESYSTEIGWNVLI